MYPAIRPVISTADRPYDDVNRHVLPEIECRLRATHLLYGTRVLNRSAKQTCGERSAEVHTPTAIRHRSLLVDLVA